MSLASAVHILKLELYEKVSMVFNALCQTAMGKKIKQRKTMLLAFEPICFTIVLLAIPRVSDYYFQVVTEVTE